MYKIHRPHLLSGYLASFRFEATRDEDGNKDWDMYYEPGPKARAEYRSFTGDKQRVVESAPTLAAPGETTNEMPIPRSSPRQRRFVLKAAPPEVDAHLLAELTKRGVSASRATKLLVSIQKNQNVMDQLEWGDYQIHRASPGEIRNPAGFYINLIEENVTPPSTFESSRIRRERDDHRAQVERELEKKAQREAAYNRYRIQEIERYIAEQLTGDELAQLTRTEEIECRRKYPNLPKQTINEMVPRGVRFGIADRIGLLTFEEFCDRDQNNPEPPSDVVGGQA
jgi:hypothetical protein